MLKTQYYNKGFSLIEVIVALGVFSVLAAGVFNIVTSSYKNFYGVGDRQVVGEFAKEGIEASRAIRDNSWQDIEDVADAGGTYGTSKASGGYWEFTGAGSGSDTLGDLTREITVSDVMRDSNDEIVSSGGTDDPTTKKVVVTISGTGISDYVLSAYLTDWNNKTWFQTDWSGVGDREFWSDNTMASSSYSNISTSTGGEIKLSGSYDTPGYLYSSIYHIDSSDKELKSVTVEQNVPSGCTLQVTVEVSDSNTFLASGVSSYLFGDTTATYYVSSTPASLNGKEYLRYKVDMTACSSNTNTPTLDSIKINYR